MEGGYNSERFDIKLMFRCLIKKKYDKAEYIYASFLLFKSN